MVAAQQFVSHKCNLVSSRRAATAQAHISLSLAQRHAATPFNSASLLMDQSYSLFSIALCIHYYYYYINRLWLSFAFPRAE